MSKTLPLVVSQSLVPPILDGRKSMTRRIAKPQPVIRRIDYGHDVNGLPVFMGDEAYAVSQALRCGVLKPRYTVGSVLRLCEDYRLDGFTLEELKVTALREEDQEVTCHYLADDASSQVLLTPAETQKLAARIDPFRAQCGRFMYASCSRQLLEVTEVRCERVNAISEADAEAEGTPAYDDYDTSEPVWNIKRLVPAREAFEAKWDELHGTGSFARGEWVWAYTFRRVSE